MKKLSIILISLFVLIFIFIFISITFTIYKISSINETKEEMADATTYLMDSISYEDYDRIRLYVKNPDATDLSDEEMLNFLFNTGLYRAMLINSGNPTFTYSTKVNFFNHKKGTISFSFQALDGDTIRNELEYINTGINNYLIANNTQKINIEKEKYPVAVDLASGKDIGYNVDDPESLINFYSFVQDENGTISVEVIKDVKEDVKISMKNMMYDELESLKSINEEYDIKWDDDFKVFSIYWDKDTNEKLISLTMQLRIILCAMVVQALNENPDWELTINYYDYSTEELLKTDVVR